ncbi:hypothetical protein UCRPC4_g03670 [Phaeomoniella chlamydospora]|uniref:Uncharacterized protein n=1 Tax=Phaeomoniella chlamydospora TaxID=158046 RepID=A0A0G2EEW8_PHACM|nr:hypothetical protein UCRPC4_g03670 [Phaeomoniella chlamydospora]
MPIERAYIQFSIRPLHPKRLSKENDTSKYESIKTVDKPTETQTGILSDIAPKKQDGDEAKTERGERVAENIRYGQAISEEGFGGKTTESDGVANPEGTGGAEDRTNEEDTKNTRREQKYGSMPNIGA